MLVGDISVGTETSYAYALDMQESRIKSIGAALSDHTRSTMVAALMSGTAHTAGELARIAGVAASTASEHLRRLVDAGLVSVEPSGRHRYYRISSLEVARFLEHMDSITLPAVAAPKRPNPGSELSFARCCYDHLAGHLGVQLYESLVRMGVIAVSSDGATLAPAGSSRFERLGIDVPGLAHAKRILVRPCLDWTQRKHHLGGALGAALLSHMISEGWPTRRVNRRVLRLTKTGRSEMERHFALVLSV